MIEILLAVIAVELFFIINKLDVSGSAANEMMHMLLRYRRTIWEYAKRD